MSRLGFHSPPGTHARRWVGRGLSILILSAVPAFGQIHARRPSDDVGVRGLRGVGNTSVERSTRDESRFRGQYDPAQPSAGNYDGLSSGTAGLDGGRMNQGSMFTGESTGGGGYFSRSGGPFMRAYTAPVFDGQRLFTTSRDAPAVLATQRNAFMFHHIITTMREGGTAPAINPRFGRDIRDDLTKESLANAPPAENRLQESGHRRTHAEMLSERIAAERDRAVQQGWQLVGERHFVRAIPRFEAAEAADRDCTEARVGIFMAALTDGSIARADAVLRRIIISDPDVFQMKIDVRSKLPDPEFFDATASSIGRTARQNSKDPGLAALHAFYVWYLGQPEEALRVAEEVYRDHRTSPYGPMAARMRGEKEASSESPPDETLGAAPF